MNISAYVNALASTSDAEQRRRRWLVDHLERAAMRGAEPRRALDPHHERLALDVTADRVGNELGWFPPLHRTSTHCVKFLDSRCANKPTKISVLRYGEDAGAGCHLDPSSSATRLDNKLMQTANTGDTSDHTPIRKPLENVHIIGTQSEPSKIYAIRYMLGFDELTEDSKLYRAMAAKYGEPIQKNPPNEMRWKGDDTRLTANCDRIHCEIFVEDTRFEDFERHRQEEADGRARRETASAPKL